jgi:drug/metabolite transporter (DMT)-like permease
MHSLFVLLGMSAFGISNVLWKPLLGSRSSNSLLFSRSCWTVGILLLLFITGAFVNEPPEWLKYLAASKEGALSPGNLISSVAYILLSLAGLYLFIYSLSQQAAGISGMIVCTSTTLSAVLGWLVNDDPFHWTLVSALLLCSAGILLLDGTDLRSFRLNKGLVAAMSGAACWGVANLGFKQMIPETGVLPFSLLQETTVLSVSGLGLMISGAGDKSKSLLQVTNSSVVLIGLLTLFGVVFCNLGMNGLHISRFAVLVLAQPLTTFLLATFWLKERTSFLQKFGAGLILIGIYLAASN